MATRYEDAPEVRRIAEKLIPDHHEHLLEHRVRLEYVFSDKAVTKGGRVTFGTARKISSLNAFLAGNPDTEETAPFFVITIWRDGWKQLNFDQRTALVDHELMHCMAELDGDDNVRLTLRPHDLEEFNDIVKRHGLWKPDVEAMAEAIETAQLGLPFGRLPDGIRSATISVNGGPAVPAFSPEGRAVAEQAVRSTLGVEEPVAA